jgi:uncharacterized C2H2 Zn-finger protein
MENKRSKKSKKQKCYHCDICDYSASQKSNWDRHIETIKHKKKMATGVSILETESVILETEQGFKCNQCGKIYKSKGGVYKHVKKCAGYHKKWVKNTPFLETKTSKTSIFDGNNGNNDNKNDIVESLLKVIEKKDEQIEMALGFMKNQSKTTETMMEFVKNGGQGMGHHNTINSNNTNNITVNMYLTEHCKDAMFLDDFVKNIQIKLRDVMNGDLLEDNVISNVIVQKLEDLDPTKRPIHCTDPKRRKFVVNDKKDGWVKDSLMGSNSKLKDGLEDVQRNAFLSVYDEFDETYKPPHEDQLEKKKSAVVNSLRGPLISGKGTDKIVRDVAEIVNIKEAIKSLKDNQ